MGKWHSVVATNTEASPEPGHDATWEVAKLAGSGGGR
jgi:hypothetical protein